jgi:hypothetical protein
LGDGGISAWVAGERPPNELIVSEINSSYIIVIIIAVSACACLLIATPIVYTAFVSKKKAQRSGNYLTISTFSFSRGF